MSAAVSLDITVEDYLRAEADAPERHAFHDGETFAMAGGSTVHALLGAEVGARLSMGLAGKPCAALSGDQRIHVDRANISYADVVVLCPPVERPPNDRHGATNPTAIVEVLSPSTEAWDRGPKFALYKRLPSLVHYVLVAQDYWQIDHFRRMDDGSWRMTSHGPGDEVDLDTLGVRFKVDDVYAKVEAFGGPGREAVPRGPGRSGDVG